MRRAKTLKLGYHTCLTERGEVLRPDRPANLSGLRIDVFPDQVVPPGGSGRVSTGLHQVHISGTPHALRELGTYLLAIAENHTVRDMVDHFEPIRGAGDRAAVHLVVHHSYRRDLGPTVEIQ